MAIVSTSGRTDWDAIVIGSGAGGLSSAAFLAANGKRVLLLEQYDLIGGNIHVFRRQGKYEFDVGVHYLGDCGEGGAMQRMLSGLALQDRLRFNRMDVDGHDTFVLPFGKRVAIPSGWDRFEHNMVEAFPRSASGIRRYLRVMKAIADNLDLVRSMSSSEAFDEAVRRSGPAGKWARRSHAALLAASGMGPFPMGVLGALNGAFGATPLTARVSTSAAMLKMFVDGGAWFPRGGGQAIAARFGEVVVAHGGSIRTRTKVEKILVESGKVAGVRLVGGETITAPVVVSNADIVRTFAELLGPEYLTESERKRVRRWVIALPLPNAYFGLKIDLRGTPNTNYYVLADHMPGPLDIVRAGGHIAGSVTRLSKGSTPWKGIAPFMPGFVMSSTVRDPDNPHTAPAGHSVVEAMLPIPYVKRLWEVGGQNPAESNEYRSEAAYLQVKEHMAQAAATTIEAAWPGAKASIVFSEAATPATQERYTLSTKGSPFGLSITKKQNGPDRPGSTTSIPGLFLAGTSTRWGPGVVGSLTSGLQAAGAVLGRDLDTELREGAVYVDKNTLPPMAADDDPLAVSKQIAARTARKRIEVL